MKNSRKTTMEILNENGVVLTAYQFEIIKKLDKIPNGRNARIVYKADKSKSIKAAYKNTYKVTKYSTFSIQKGIDYANKKAVKEKRAQQLAVTGYCDIKEPWYYKFDKNIARSKSNPNQLYLLAGTNTNKNSKGISYYEVTSLNNGVLKTQKMTSQELKALGIMIESFWADRSSEMDFRTFKLDDVLDVYSKSKR